ncbi:MAG: amino acid ABC transporter substrate-binding protein [Gammaproteobacteria bacterium]
MTRFLMILCLLCSALSAAFAQAPPDTLAKIADTKRLAIGYVPDAQPMSFEDAAGQPVGYSIELCKIIAGAVQEHLGLDELAIDYVPLMMPGERIEAIVSGKVDIECSAATITLGRRQQVDFTLMTLITGASSLSLAKAGIRTNADLNGKRLVVVQNTTTEKALDEFLAVNEYQAKITKVDTHHEAMTLLDQGKVDAHVGDQIILTGHVIAAAVPDNYRIAPDVFSYEPYGFMIPKGDPDFRLVADEALARFYRTARIQRLYHNWFGRYGLRQSPVLQAMYQFQGLPD